MGKRTQTNITITDRELVIRKIFNAPREEVFKAWTALEYLADWWGPKGYVLREGRLKFKPGCVFHYGLKQPNWPGLLWGKLVYQEIVPPVKIIYTSSYSDEFGNAIRHPFIPTWPMQTVSKVILLENAGKTFLTLKIGPQYATDKEYMTFQNRMGEVRKEFEEILLKLDEHLTNHRAVNVSRTS